MLNNLVKCILGLVIASPAFANQPVEMSPIAINGIMLGDRASKIKAQRSSGKCESSSGSLTECTLFDGDGVEYQIVDDHVVRMEVDLRAKKGVKLPFGVEIGENLVAVLGRSFPPDGGRALVIPAGSEVTVVRMIQERDVGYEFELHMRFDGQGRLASLVYKDVL